MKKTYRFFIALATAFLTTGCSGGTDEPDPSTPQNPTEQEKMAIRISPTVEGSRATDTAFENGDCIGLYVVNYSGNKPGSLANSGNHVNNMRFRYDGAWTPDSPVAWADAETHADFYVYYPYASVQSVNAYSFSVRTDQSTESAYKASDLMTGKSLNVAPTTSSVNIPVSHVMGRAVIYLEAGYGITEQQLESSAVSVKLNGLRCTASVDLASGYLTPTGQPSTITPLHTDGCYKALVVPQTADSGTLITVTLDGREYRLQKEFTFEGGKSHKFTVTLSKTSAGVNVNITPWVEDSSDNGGTAE